MKKFLLFIICFQIIGMPVFAEYDFSDEAQAEFDRNKSIIIQSEHFSKKKTSNEIKEESLDNEYIPEIFEFQTQTSPQQKVLYGNVVHVPAGTTFNVTFDSGISSGSLEKNDRLTVRLTEDLIFDGHLIVPANSLVYGSAVSSKNAGYAYGSGAMEINFNEILTPDGVLIPISTETIYLYAKSERALKMTRDIVVGALGSMLIGAAFTALGAGTDWGRNMAVYGGLGAIGGGMRGAMQRGEDIEIPDGKTIQVKLLEPLSTSIYRF